MIGSSDPEIEKEHRRRCLAAAAEIYDAPTPTTEALDAYVEQALILQGYTYSINDTHVGFSCIEPPEDAYDAGSLVPVYAIRARSEK